MPASTKVTRLCLRHNHAHSVHIQTCQRITGLVRNKHQECRGLLRNLKLKGFGGGEECCIQFGLVLFFLFSKIVMGFRYPIFNFFFHLNENLS